MANVRYWLSLVAFERAHPDQNVLPDWAEGAVGWMVALAPDGDTARDLLVRDLGQHGLRVLEVQEVQEVAGADQIEEIDEHLAANFRDIEPGKQTVWGTLNCYVGEGEA